MKHTFISNIFKLHFYTTTFSLPYIYIIGEYKDKFKDFSDIFYKFLLSESFTLSIN